MADLDRSWRVNDDGRPGEWSPPVDNRSCLAVRPATVAHQNSGEELWPIIGNGMLPSVLHHRPIWDIGIKRAYWTLKNIDSEGLCRSLYYHYAIRYVLWVTELMSSMAVNNWRLSFQPRKIHRVIMASQMGTTESGRSVLRRT